MFSCSWAMPFLPYDDYVIKHLTEVLTSHYNIQITAYGPRHHTNAKTEIPQDSCSTSLVKTCFEKSRFGDFMDDSENIYEDENIPLSVVAMVSYLYGCDFSDLVYLDHQLSTHAGNVCDWSKPAHQLLSDLN